MALLLTGAVFAVLSAAAAGATASTLVAVACGAAMAAVWSVVAAWLVSPAAEDDPSRR